MLSSKLPLSTVLLALGSLVACGSSNEPGGDSPSSGGQPGSAGSGSTVAGSSTAAGAGALGGSTAGGAGAGGAAGGSGGMPAAAGGAGSAAGGQAAGSAGQAASGGGAGGAAGGGAGGGSAFPDPSTFVCNGMLGVSVNDDWFIAGFEDVVGTAKWQLRWKSLGFIEQWADPQNSIWSEPLVSACSNGSTNPDRVLFTGVNWTYTTAAQWVTQLTGVVETIKAKYAGVKEIDLMTMVRAPNNVICGNPSGPSTREQVTAPFVDEAMATVAAKYPGLVRVAPPFYAPNCDVFLTDSPHYAAGKAAVVSKVFSDYYATH